MANPYSMVVPTPPEPVTTPTPFLSSAEVGWEGLLVRAFQDPACLEGWIEPLVPDITLVLFLQGTIRMESLQSHGTWYPMRFQQGDLFLTPGTDPHEVRWWSLTPEPPQTLQIRLRRDSVEQTAVEMGGRSARAFSWRGRTGFRDPFLAQVGVTLLQELQRGAPGSAFYAQTVAQMLTVHLLRHYASITEGTRGPAPTLTTRQLQRVCDYVQAHLHLDVSLNLLAQEAGLSSYYFARIFRQMTGTSPHQYVLRQRLERAQDLLTSSDRPLAAIALECGFANQSHLAHAFARRLGTSPSAYRQRPQTCARFDTETARM